MKKCSILILLLIGSLSFLKAQDDNGDKRADKIQALKIAFITQKLQLTSAEAQQFWPVYGEYENELKSVIADKSGDVIDNDERLLNTRKKYRPQFTKLLGEPRMNKLFSAEKEFRGVLLQRLKNRNNQQPPALQR